MALLLEENAEKVSTSSQQNVEDIAEYQQYYGQEGEDGQEMVYGEEEDPYYNEEGY